MMLHYYQSYRSYIPRFVAWLLILLAVIRLGSNTPLTLAQSLTPPSSVLSLADLPAADRQSVLGQIQAADYYLMPGQTGLKDDNLHVFNTAGAIYPDPLLTSQVAKLTANDGDAWDLFGFDVSISDDTLVVGAVLDDDYGEDSGSAYVFTRNQGGSDGWGLVKKLTVSEGTDASQFGVSVAINGDTIVVGAIGDDSFIGAAYIFERNQGGADNWGLVKKLIADDGAEGDSFGWAVAISGNTIAVGTGAEIGAAYIFERNQGGADNWGQVKKLTAPDGAVNDQFGSLGSVALSSDTVVIGAVGDDDKGDDSGSAYIFERNQGGVDNWEFVKKLTTSDAAAGDKFGAGVAIDNDTIVIGAGGDNTAIGAAYVFERNQGGADNWGQVTKLTADDGAADDEFGFSVSISGDAIAVGAWQDDDSGAVYLFDQNQGGADNWGQVTKLTTDDRPTGDTFGIAVAQSGNTLVIGAAAFEDTSAPGAAYTFQRSGSGWEQLAKPTADDIAAGDEFGWSVAVSGNTLVVGADADDNNGSRTGSAYVFTRNQGGSDGWGFVKKLTADDGATVDWFGSAVGISGDTIVVGAYGNDSNTGAVYVFARNQGGADNWGQVKKLTASDGSNNYSFGLSIAIDGDTLVAGSPLDNSAAGSAYIFERNQGGADNWGEVEKLTADDATAGDWFGWSVDISGDRVVGGAYADDGYTGAAYIFERNQGGADSWGQVKKVIANDAAVENWFGFNVAISIDTIVVGALFDDDNGDASGSAYVFERNQGGADNWGQLQKLTANDAAADDQFGEAVAIRGDIITIGAYLDDDNGDASGSVYVFERNQGWADNWGQVQKLTPNDAAADDHFGNVVDIDGNTVAIGASWDDLTYTSLQSAYVFGLVAPTSPEIAVEGNGQFIGNGSTIPSPTNHTDFGSVAPTNAITRTFTISNSGSAALSLTGSPAVTLTTATAFSVTTQPESTTVAANSRTPFTVTFMPLNTGFFTDTVTIANNDDDENPYTFVISGTGLAPDLTLMKSVAPATATPGQTITYTLAFSNTGPVSASGVIITDVVPVSISLVSIDSSMAITQSGSMFEIGSLSGGMGGVITLTAQISPNLSAGVFTNTASIGSNTTETDTGNNSDKAGVTVIMPTVSLALGGSPIAEAGGTATVTATLSTAAALPVTVTLAYSGSATHIDDYTRSGNQIVIPAGKRFGTAVITAVQDTVDEPNETVVVAISAVSNGIESGSQKVTVTIIDDDGAGLAAFPTALSLAEPDGAGTIRLTLTSRPTSLVTINLSRDDTSECYITPTSVALDDSNWNSGTDFTVIVADDTEVDGSQSCIITGLSSSSDAAYNGQVLSIIATITDDDTESDSVYLPIILTN